MAFHRIFTLFMLSNVATNVTSKAMQEDGACGEKCAVASQSFKTLGSSFVQLKKKVSKSRSTHTHVALPRTPPEGACLTSAAMLQTPKGPKAIGNLSKQDSVTVFEIANISGNGKISNQDLLGLAVGRVIGWARIDPESTAEVLEIIYDGAIGKLQLTRGHELMVKDGESGVALKLAEDVGAGDYLAATQPGGQAGVSWKKVLSSQSVTATGLYVPLVKADAGPGDVLVLSDGILVPVYAEYGGFSPAQAHQVMMVWEANWQQLLVQHPCLDKVYPGHKMSVAVEILRDFSVLHPGKLLKEELNPTLMMCHLAETGLLNDSCPELAHADANCMSK